MTKSTCWWARERPVRPWMRPTFSSPPSRAVNCKCIGATTLDEYRKHIESDAALERRFQPIVVDEPTVEETIEILKGIRKMYEEHHHLVISDEALEAAAHLSARYVSDRFLPDKAIDLIDESASRVRMYKVRRDRLGQGDLQATQAGAFRTGPWPRKRASPKMCSPGKPRKPT